MGNKVEKERRKLFPLERTYWPFTGPTVNIKQKPPKPETFHWSITSFTGPPVSFSGSQREGERLTRDSCF